MKFDIRKKLVTLAVASAVGGGAMMGMTGAVHAMNVSQDNLGQVLLFPYYTVKNGYDTLFSVTNTSDETAIIKIRWREALNSREVRDFNVILSPQDVWTGVVTSNGDGALIRTFDNTCTSPILPASATVSGAREVAFTNQLFTGGFTDGATGDISRVQEGYFEVFLMGVSDRNTSDSANTLEYNAKHVNGVPRNCAAVDGLFLNASAINGYFDTPTNVLKGHSTFINVVSGKAIDVEPTAIENFQTDSAYVAAPGDLIPDLRDGDVISDIMRFVDGQLDERIGVVGSENAVSELLRATSVMNEFATGSNVSTSWVLTFPSKHHFTDSYTPSTGPSLTGTASGGFSEWFFNGTGNSNSGRSCDDISVSLWNREEGTVVTAGNTQFSPQPPAGQNVALCYEANVVDFNNSSVFGTGANRLGINTSQVGSAGWAKLNFIESSAVSAGGLPVIGFSATVRDGANATVNYGSAAEHSYERPPVVVVP